MLPNRESSDGLCFWLGNILLLTVIKFQIILLERILLLVTIKESTEEKLLGVIFEKKLCFKQLVRSICKNAGQKLHALSRISHFLDTEQL